MTEDNFLLVHFPLLFKELVPESIQPLALFLNPGLYEPSEDTFRPQSLVLSTRDAQSFLSQCVQFGDQFKNPSDMAYLGVKKADDFYSDTSLSLRWQISTYGQQDKQSDKSQEYIRAQQLLLLEYVLEERVSELDKMNASLGAAWNAFDTSLGIDRDDETFSALDREFLNTAANATDWKKLLWAFSLLLPLGARLLVSQEQTWIELEEAGVHWQSISAEKYPWDLEAGINAAEGFLDPGLKDPYLSRIQNRVNFLRISSS